MDNPVRLAEERRVIARVVIDCEPVPKGRPRVGRRGTYTPEKTKNYEEYVRWQIRLQNRLLEPFTGTVRLDIDFCQKSRYRYDLDNLVKAFCDAGNGLLWVDDSQILVLCATLERGCAVPRTEAVVSLWPA